MTSEASFYSERLAHKEHELDELQAAFNKYKLKAKVKFDQLRKEVNAYCSENGYSLNERENNALLLIRLAENETAMEAACRETEVLRKEVARKQTQLNDQLILIKNMEEQIRSSQPLSPVEIQERKRAAQMIDLDKIQQQMLFKDERIVELNNVILDKERQILDLQELCREQGEVASVTSQAARIVQRQWEDKNRERREVGTETDSSLWNSTARIGQRDPEVRARTDSPGRAVVTNRGTANTSPPPLDPSEVLERTSRRDEADDHLGASNSFLGKSPELDSSFRKKNRKRVTFDLLSTFQQQQQQQQATRTPSGEQFTQVVIELSEENERLRKALLEARTNLDQLQSRADEVDADMTRLVREGKNQALKARAVAQARIKELEDRMAELNGQHADQVERLQTEIESLRSTREWEVEQNAQLREQLNEAKNKNHKLTEELDASEKANREWEVKMAHGEEFLDQLIEDLAEAEDIINYMEQQKHSILDDVDKLKDAIIAQDQLIEILEADIVIYEEHIGILRESLGASKIDHRSLLRSKAFETKLKALEKEKEQINRRSNEDRLRTKALSQKCKVLEEENEKLMEKLCELEMRERDEAEMAETCRQLEQRIAEAEQKAAVSKAECDLRVEAARLEAESKSNEAAELLRELRDAQQKLSVRSSSVERRVDAGRPGQSSMSDEVEQLRSQAAQQDLQLAHLRLEVAQVNQLREELEAANRKFVETAEELDAIRCSNFELMTKVDSYSVGLKAAEEERDSLREMYERMSVTLSQKERQEAARNERTAAIEQELEMTEAELEAARQKSEGLAKELATVQNKLTQTELSLASHRVDLGESHERINRLEEELFATRAELDNARLGLQETNNVKKELEHLKEALEHERSSGRAKWEEVCRKVLESESSLPQSRKSSLEVINKVQHLEYITAFEEKITCLESELQEARTKIEQEKAEKKKLKAALKQMRIREKNANELTEVQQQSVAHPSHAAVTQEQPLQAAAPSVVACEGDLEKLKMTVRELELENRLSRELNTEYSHTMLEMEKEVIALKAQITSLRGESEHFEMELKLHEMLEEELEKELTDARLKNQELSEAVQSQEESLERFSERVTNDAAKNDEYTNGLVAEVYQLREQEIVLKEQLRVAAEKLAAEESLRAQEREHFSEVDRAHCEEVRELSISLADARRMISDVEVRLAEAEGSFTESQSQVASLRTALDAKTVEIRELQHEITLLREAGNTQQTALLRGASSTSEVVASVLVGETEAVRRDVNLETEPETHVPQDGVTSAALEDTTLGEDAEGTRTTTVPQGSDLFAENLILRQCVNETNQMQNDLSQDVEKMWQLKTELENAVEALKGEIWSLNGQLKASILDREQLQDQVVQLDSSLAAEKKRADALDCELSEQTELTEKASRQAAEAENESNRRLAECLEMETRREQVEKAYAQLSEYYSQLQAAYNVIYTQLKQIEAERAAAESAQQASTSCSTNDDNVRHVVDTMIAELHLDVGSDVDLHGKVLLIQKALREKLAELSEHHQAIAEHRRTNEALHEQLRSLEEETHKAGDETADAKARLLHLEGELEWKQDECDSLRRRVNELQAAIDQLVDRDSETDALAASRLRIELAILAAKLATRQADVDALFRANAELAHTNVRLQNELEQSEERTSAPDELRRIEELQEELSASKSNEEVLQRQLAEVRAILNETEQKLEEFSLSERTSKASRSVETQNETSEAATSESFHELECSTPCVGFEEVMKEHDKLRDEVERLQAVEKLLNERIMCLEDQLLEEEEKLQEFDEELISERRKVKILEAEKQSAAQLEVVNNTNQGMSEESQWGFSDRADVVEGGVQLQLGFPKGQEQDEQAEFYAQDSWGADVSGSAASRQEVEDELAQVRDELEQLKRELDEQKRVAPSRRDDGEVKRTENEWNALKRELNVLQEALLEKEAAAAGTEQSEDAWGWEDSRARGSAELSTLQRKLAQMASVEQEHKEIIKKQQDRISKLEEELSTADTYREELEDASKQVNDLQREIREMKKQAKLREEEEERFKARISALEAKAESSWPDEWGANVVTTEEEMRAVEQSRAETCRRIEELELKVKERESALAAAEDELSKLRSSKSRKESRRETSALQTAFEDSSSNDQAAPEAGNEVELERQMREEAEALADGLRRVVATLRIQVDELQEKVLAEQEAATQKSTEIDELTADNDRLRTAIASRTELQEAEHQRTESELETLREERRRIQDDLSSAENEKIRLEEQLMASKMKCDDLSTELQLQRADSSELRQTIQELNERCESAQAMLQTALAENSSLLERLSETKGDLDEVRRQLRVRIEREQVSSSTSAAEMTKWEQLEQILGDVRRELAEKELQNSLLKDSEAKLLDSVDEYGSQAEKYQREAERLQTVVNQLEEERMALEKEIEDMKKNQNRNVEDVPSKHLPQEGTSSSPSLYSRELSLVSGQVEALTAERNELRNRLEKAESRLEMSLKEKQAVSRSYEQLRARLAARRQVATASNGSSRRSNASTSEVDASEVSPPRAKEPERSPSGTFISYQATEKEVIRRRPGHH